MKAASLLLVCGLLGAMTACASAPPTKVAAVADIGAKIESSATALLNQAVSASQTLNPSTNQPFVTVAQRDVVAIAVDKIGHLGLSLEAALNDYTAVKTAGGNVVAQTLNVQQIIADINTALSSIGKAIPIGTVAAIDQAVSAVAGVLLTIQAGVLL